jgi:hypothetical protein
MTHLPAFLRTTRSGARTSRPYAVIGAAIVLTLGVGGAGFAAGLVTSDDIKDDTVASIDVKNGTLKQKDLAATTVENLMPRVIISRKGPGSYLTEDPTTGFHTMTVPEGRWLVSVTATAFPGLVEGTPFASCLLKAPDWSSGTTTTTIASPDAYASLATQITVSAGGDTLVSLECSGENAGVNRVTITAVEAGSITIVADPS